MNTIRNWLTSCGFEQYADEFEANDIDFETLLELSNEDLRELGVQALGHRKKLLKAIEQLDAPPESTVSSTSEGERRQISVMFCDLVGSTALSTQLDAEEMDNVVRRFQETVSAAIHQYGGHVARFAGDGILAYFGYPHTLEREAERAIQSAMRGLNDVAKANFHPGIDAQMRVGIATGDVVIGGLYDQGKLYEAMATGETPNLAARLQGCAEPGNLVVCDTTRRLAGSRFLFQDQGQESLKGFSTPVQIWGIKESAELLEQSTTSAFLDFAGRDAELTQLHNSWQKALDGAGNVVFISGQAGLGKSRLVEIFWQSFADNAPNKIRLECQPYSKNTPFFSVIELLNTVMQVTTNDSMELRRERLNEFATSRIDSPDMTIALIAQLLGIADASHKEELSGLSPQLIRDATFDAIVELTAQVALRAPLIYEVEDLHWADASTLQFLAALAERIQELPTLMIMTSRSEFQLTWSDDLPITRIELNGLSDASLLKLIDQYDTANELNPHARQQILQRAQGIPLYAQELSRSVVEHIREAGGPVGFAQASVPDSLQSMMMARLDRLGDDKELILVCSVLGSRFERELLTLVLERGLAEISRSLSNLVDAEFLTAVSDSQTAIYSFAHSLLRDAAYNNLLRSHRRELHRKVATVLQEYYPQAVAAHPERLAHHLTGGEQYPEAIATWITAGRTALVAGANIEAIEHLEHGLSLLDHLSDESELIQNELALKMMLAPALAATRGYAAPEVAVAFNRARQLCQTIGASEELFPVLRGLMSYYIVAADFESALAIGAELAAAVESSPSSGHQIEWNWNMGSALLFHGQLDRAIEHLAKAEQLYNFTEHNGHALIYGQDPGVAGMAHLAIAKNTSGHYKEAIELEKRTEELAIKLGHPFSIAQARLFRVAGHAIRGEIDAARNKAQQNITFSEEQRFPVWQGLSMMNLANILSQDGENSAIELAEAGYATYSASGAKVSLSNYLPLLAQAHFWSGDLQRGIELVDQAIEHCEHFNERLYEPGAYITKAMLLEKLDPQKYQEEIRSILGQATTKSINTGTHHYSLIAATTLLNFEIGLKADTGKALDQLMTILEGFADEPNVPTIAKARALIATV